MQVRTLDGKLVRLDTRGRMNPSTHASGLHAKVRGLLKERLTTQIILEEVPVPVKEGKTLFLDFLIPMKKLIVEVNGAQHYSFNSQFHKDQQGFINQGVRDKLKREWAELNGLTMLELHFSEEKRWGEILDDYT